MVGVAQVVEHRIVAPVVGGSNPLAHPILFFENKTLAENCSAEVHDAPVAQLDRALDSGSKGRGFESRRAHHLESVTYGRHYAGRFQFCIPFVSLGSWWGSVDPLRAWPRRSMASFFMLGNTWV